MGAYATGYQLYTSAALLFAGFLSSLSYDLMLPACHLCSRSLQFIMDIFLCTVTALLIFMALYCTGGAALRAYMLFSFFGGALVYHFSLRRFFRALIKYRKQKRKKDMNGE